MNSSTVIDKIYISSVFIIKILVIIMKTIRETK